MRNLMCLLVGICLALFAAPVLCHQWAGVVPGCKCAVGCVCRNCQCKPGRKCAVGCNCGQRARPCCEGAKCEPDQ